MVKDLQNETSCRAVNHVDELSNIQNPVLRESGHNKRKFTKDTEELSGEKGQEKFSPDDKRQMKNKHLSLFLSTLEIGSFCSDYLIIFCGNFEY